MKSAVPAPFARAPSCSAHPPHPSAGLPARPRAPAADAMQNDAGMALQRATAWPCGGVRLKPTGGDACMRWRIDIAASLPRALHTAGVFSLSAAVWPHLRRRRCFVRESQLLSSRLPISVLHDCRVRHRSAEPCAWRCKPLPRPPFAATRVSAVPVQMLAGQGADVAGVTDQSRSRCGRGGPSPEAYAAWMSAVPGQIVAGVSAVPWHVR
jgi:hypothetical protein